MSATPYEGLTTSQSSSALNTWLWIAQLSLALFFLLAGGMHAFMPIDRAAKFAAWIASAPVALVRLIGVVEIAGALGVVLPAATRVKPWLTPLAAAGLALIMLLAMPVHLMRGEARLIDRNVLALLLAAFVVWGRTTRARISERDS